MGTILCQNFVTRRRIDGYTNIDRPTFSMCCHLNVFNMITSRKEKNQLVFQHKEIAVLRLLAKIKEEAQIWVLAGAKKFREFLPSHV